MKIFYIQILLVSVCLIMRLNCKLQAQTSSTLPTENPSSVSFANKSYYLIDSLNLESLHENDRKLIDKWIKNYHAAKSDTAKVNAISNICEEMMHEDWHKYQLFQYRLIKAAIAKDPPTKVLQALNTSLSVALNNIGFIFMNKGDIAQALNYYNSSLKIREETGDKKGIATSLNNIGLIYKQQGNIAISLEHFHKCLKISEEIRDKKGIAGSLINIGFIYKNQGNVPKALEYYQKSLEIEKELGNNNGVATSLNNIGAIYMYQGDISTALEYYYQSLEIYEKAGEQRGVAYSLNNIGLVYYNQNNQEKALEYFYRSLKIREEAGDKQGIATSLNSIGNILLDKGLLVGPNGALAHFQRSMKLANQLGFPTHIGAAAHLLSKTYEKQGKGMEALEMYKLYVQMHDSILNEENEKEAISQQVKYEYEKQRAIDIAEHEKTILLERKEKEKQKALTYATAGGLAMVIIFLFFVFNRLRITRKQKDKIDFQRQEIETTHLKLAEHHKEISDSIVYAQRLQQAILPSNDELKKELKNNFIFFQPKDVVSGDFYWMEKVGQITFLAAADCTGHGVPGAMVSVVCSNALDRAVKEFGLKDTGKILDKVTDLVIERFEKSSAEVRDGMDIGLCAFNWETKKLQYSGANNPLWIIRKRTGNDEVEKKDIFNEDFYFKEYKGTKQPIGKYIHRKPFQAVTINIQKEDCIYIFSDGFADQFGGPLGKKYKYKPLKQLLLSIQEKKMEEQKQIIINVFEEWKSKLEQVDDVCVIGVQV